MKGTAAGILLIVITLLFAGCGGGGGGTTAPSAGVPNSVAGKVTVSGVGLGAVTIKLNGTPYDSCDQNGSYSITGLPTGVTYTVTPYLAGYTFNPASRDVTISGSQAAAADFSAAPIPPAPTYTISGKVESNNGGGLNGTTLTVTRAGNGAYAGTAATDGAGLYSIGGIPDGDYIVTATHPTGITLTVPVTVSGANATAGFSAPVATYTVSGKVSTGSQDLANVAITLTTTTFDTTVHVNPIGSALSDAQGNYSIGGIPEGFFGVKPVLSGYNFVEDSGVSVNGGNVTKNITGALPPDNGGSAGISL